MMDIIDIMSPSTPTSPDFVSEQVVSSRYLFLDLALSPAAELMLSCAGREKCESDYFLTRNGFHCHAVELVLSGQWILEHEGQSYELGPGSVFAYRPDTCFTLKASGSGVFSKYFVDFFGDEAERLLAMSGLTIGQPQVVTPIRWVRELLDQILDCRRYPQSVAKEMGAQLTRLFLMRVLQDGRPDSLPKKDSFFTYQRCRDYIREHFKELMGMDELSKACHIDPSYLSRLFKKHSGESPYQLLIRFKMEYAAELLRYRNYSVKAAAAELGYEDPFHFSRVFKKVLGSSPRHFV